MRGGGGLGRMSHFTSPLPTYKLESDPLSFNLFARCVTCSRPDPYLLCLIRAIVKQDGKPNYSYSISGKRGLAYCKNESWFPSWTRKKAASYVRSPFQMNNNRFHLLMPLKLELCSSPSQLPGNINYPVRRRIKRNQRGTTPSSIFVMISYGMISCNLHVSYSASFAGQEQTSKMHK